MARTLLICALLCSFSQIATAQNERRGVVFGDLGYARTMDDEGTLGKGATVSGGVGWRVTPRLTIQGIIDRIRYYRDVEWLTFDGRVLFAGVEAAFQSARPSVRPFVTVGVGLFDDDGTWIVKTMVGPGLSRVEEQLDRSYTLAAMTASGGLDFRASDRFSVRAGVRFHGLLDTGDDLAPHTIVGLRLGGVWRW